MALMILAEPPDNVVLAMIVPLSTVVTADKVPTLTVLAFAIPTILADAALMALMMLAEPPDKVVLAVMVPPMNAVFAIIFPACNLVVNVSVVVT